MAEVTPPPFLDVDSVYGADDLGVPYRDLIGEGVMGYEDLRVRQRAAGANMSVDVGSGVAWIMGDESLQQPRYRVYNDATKNVTVSAADATNPRIDLVIAEVRDAVFSGAFNDWRLRVVAGTPSAGATLDNRTGAAALPNNSILLADLLIPNGDTTVGDAEIRDRRPFAPRGVLPPLLTDMDAVQFEAAPGLNVIATTGWSHSVHDLLQTAALMYLPRRIVAATRIRFRYGQNATTALTGNYVISIFDASGRKIVDTGTVAATGATGSYQERSETITATTFEAGYHYVFVGIDSTAGSCSIHGVYGSFTAALGFPGPNARNMLLRAASGGVTVPTTILGLTDLAGAAADTQGPAVPLITLSVG